MKLLIIMTVFTSALLLCFLVIASYIKQLKWLWLLYNYIYNYTDQATAACR
jgi:hypothetical protein